MVSSLGSQISGSELSFNFTNSLMQAVLDLRHSITFADVTGLIKVLEIGAQLQQELLGKSVAHRQSILHTERCKCKITRIWKYPCVPQTDLLISPWSP